MALLDFTIEFDSEVQHFDEALKQEAEDRLTQLAEQEEGIVGAAVAMTQPARAASPFIYQARIVVYMRPDDVVAVKKSDTMEGALKGALSAVERQIREKRKKLNETWKRPDLPGTPDYD